MLSIIIVMFLFFFILCIAAAIIMDRDMKKNNKSQADNRPHVVISQQVPSVFDTFKSNKKKSRRH